MIINTVEFIEKINLELRNNIQKLETKPTLQLIHVGKNTGAISFRKSILREAKKVGILVNVKEFDSSNEESEIIDFIKNINDDDSITGILAFLPFDKKFNERKILDTISTKKDVDGLNSKSFSKILHSKKYNNISTTALSTLEYLKSITELKGKDVLIINRSNIIGKPLLFMLLNEDATVQLAHSKTNDIYEKIANSDIIISAIGKAKFLKTQRFKDDAIIIDLGVSALDGKLYGDFDIENYEDINIKYLPSIGGIGKINSNMILRNTYRNGVENDRE